MLSNMYMTKHPLCAHVTVSAMCVAIEMHLKQGSFVKKRGLFCSQFWRWSAGTMSSDGLLTGSVLRQHIVSHGKRQ